MKTIADSRILAFRPVRLLALTAVSAVASVCLAQSQPAPAETSLAAQRRSLAAMEASVAAQRKGIEQQQATVVPGAFFLLPPVPRTPFPSAAGVGGCEPMPGADVEPLIQSASQREGVDAELVRNVIRQESAFRPCALSPKGAMGLMQLMPSTAATYSVRDAFDPRQNIETGTRYLKDLLNRYKGDVSLALAAYNAGPGKVDAASGVPAIPETLKYVNQVLMMLSARP